MSIILNLNQITNENIANKTCDINFSLLQTNNITTNITIAYGKNDASTILEDWDFIIKLKNCNIGEYRRTLKNLEHSSYYFCRIFTSDDIETKISNCISFFFPVGNPTDVKITNISFSNVTTKSFNIRFFVEKQGFLPTFARIYVSSLSNGGDNPFNYYNTQHIPLYATATDIDGYYEFKIQKDDQSSNSLYYDLIPGEIHYVGIELDLNDMRDGFISFTLKSDIKTVKMKDLSLSINGGVSLTNYNNGSAIIKVGGINFGNATKVSLQIMIFSFQYDETYYDVIDCINFTLIDPSPFEFKVDNLIRNTKYQVCVLLIDES